MKVTISVPDKLFKAADRLARKLKVSRSQLYSTAIAAYLDARRADEIREQLNAVCARVSSAPDPVLTKLAMQTIDPNERW